MGIIGGRFGYRLLRAIASVPSDIEPTGEPTPDDRGLLVSFGPNFNSAITDKVVIDFGCGIGRQSVAMAKRGARKVVGIDIQPWLLKRANELATEHGVTDRCLFADKTGDRADIIITRDTFEHFHNPGEILKQMSEILKPDGFVLASFGPTWYHPYGGHLFSVFPWAHLVFTEKALIRWRSHFKNDGATKFSEVAGGLNRMTIRRFEKIVADSPLKIEQLECLPIRGISILKTRLLRELGSSLVRCRLAAK